MVVGEMVVGEPATAQAECRCCSGLLLFEDDNGGSRSQGLSTR